MNLLIAMFRCPGLRNWAPQGEAWRGAVTPRPGPHGERPGGGGHPQTWAPRGEAWRGAVTPRLPPPRTREGCGRGFPKPLPRGPPLTPAGPGPLEAEGLEVSGRQRGQWKTRMSEPHIRHPPPPDPVIGADREGGSGSESLAQPPGPCSYTFQMVQGNADMFWRFQRYHLIVEYQERPALAPPFILLSHLGLVLRRVFQKEAGQKRARLERDLPEPLDQKMVTWEAVRKESHLSRLERSRRDSEAEVLRRTAHRVDVIAKQLGGLREQEKRIRGLESQVNYCTVLLASVADRLPMGSAHHMASSKGASEPPASLRQDSERAPSPPASRLGAHTSP
uniref:Transient receptor potential cation channel subfamily M member 5 n=1 Tax=Myotis myotis TaxID=51298 RepID=A0A7J7QTP7_MYOMY|nr:transient receptor potential cation channel subfamily M member 5 [Myotis myotis]